VIGRLGRAAYRVLVVGLTLLVLIPNVRLYLPRDAYGAGRIGPDVLPQLRFVRSALDDGAGERMQHLFPEGYFFTHALYGLSWIDVGLAPTTDAALRQNAIREARWALERIDSPAGRAPFSPHLDPPYGVFYVGWSTWLRGGILQLEAPAKPDPALLARFDADCAALAAAFDRSSTPFLSAYPGQAWPVDSVVAIAALRLHDTILLPRYDKLIDHWIADAKERLDPPTGLLPHRVDPPTGNVIDGARGSSQSLIARFLAEIDGAWGAQQYAAFREQFVDTPLGVPGIREYPLGSEGRGDVDSGPLIFGLSASATAVTLGAALLHDDHALTAPIIHVAEATGFPISWNGSKHYLSGALPVADAFLLWSKTAQPRIAKPDPAAFPPVVPAWWRVPIHALTLLPIALLWIPIVRRWRSKR
jgi:hypothetical protein